MRLITADLPTRKMKEGMTWKDLIVHQLMWSQETMTAFKSELWLAASGPSIYLPHSLT